MRHSKDNIERVSETIREEGVQFINLQFTDILGVVKSVGIPVEVFPDVLDHGLWFDGSSVQGFARIAESDMLLHPDLDTFAVIPWDTDVPTARVICDVHEPNGDPFMGDPRQVLRRALAEAEAMGYRFYTGPELEFFLFKPHADGSLTPLVPHDAAGYFDMSTDLAHSVRRQMVRALHVPVPLPQLSSARPPRHHALAHDSRPADAPTAESSQCVRKRVPPARPENVLSRPSPRRLQV